MSETDTSLQLPEELQQALHRFQRRWRFLNSLTLIGLLALIPLFSFALLSFSDRIWATPAWVRFILAIPVPLLMVICLAPWVKRWVIDKPGPARLAKFMGKLDPRVGDRLLGAVELAHGGNESWSGSPALRQAAILQVATQLSAVRAEERFDYRRLRMILVGTVSIFVVVAVYSLIKPEAAFNSLQRWLKPHQSIERFTFVRLTGFPQHVNVPHGETFDLTGHVSHVENEEVKEVLSKVNGTEKAEVSLNQGKVTVAVEGMTQARELTLVAGDAKTKIAITPLLRPELVAMSASVKWPDYLGEALQEVVMRRRRLEVPEGSQVSMKGMVSRDLFSVQMDQTEAMLIEGARFEMPFITVNTNLNLEVEWVDTVGLHPRQPASVELIAKADIPPSVSMSGMESVVAVLQDEFLEFDVSARDDFGLKKVWARFKQQAEVDGPAEMIEEMEMSGSTGTEKLVFSPERLGYGPGSMIELVALAVDAYPDRQPSESARFRILVLSKEDHAKILLQQMDRILAELDEAIRQESLALEANKNTAERDPQDLADDSTSEILLDRALDELARAEQLMETHRQLESLVGEATKNDQIKDEQIADWAKIAENLKNKALPAMSDAAEALKNASEAKGGDREPADPSASTNPEDESVAADPSAPSDPSDPSDPSRSADSTESSSAGSPSASGGDTIIQEQVPGSETERKKQLEQAIEKQQEALEAMKQGEDDLNESIVNSLSESFINRFKVLAQKQREVRDSLNTILPKTIGLTTDQLPLALKTQIVENAEIQEGIYRESRYIFDDLEGFYRRTQAQELRQVTQDMKAEEYTVRLPALQELIENNTLGRTTVEATEWNRLFLLWADMLTEEEDPSGQGGGGGGGDEEGESLETMIALIRGREQQEKLRRHTRALNESYAENKNFDRDAVVLSDRQYELAHSLQPLENRVVKNETKQLLSMASGEMMNVGVQLRQSNTGQESIATQTLIIEMLAKALDQSMGDQPPPSDGEGPEQNSAAMMQAIMQMMQAGSAQGQPGLNGGEGSTGFGDPGGGDISGSASGTQAGGKASQRAGSSDPGNWPGRYRGMMDRYFEAIEEGGE
ncbi:hypothetical protein P3T73_10985 [Kiritimatiellota bacterium B12222]|nr:hypothetical protein P3T73_10985 [Kiritimatiellota bacterium B12222]